jgi:hypothetical protein
MSTPIEITRLSVAPSGLDVTMCIFNRHPLPAGSLVATTVPISIDGKHCEHCGSANLDRDTVRQHLASGPSVTLTTAQQARCSAAQVPTRAAAVTSEASLTLRVGSASRAGSAISGYHDNQRPHADPDRP